MEAYMNYAQILDMYERKGIIIVVTYNGEFFVGELYYTDEDGNGVVAGTDAYTSRWEALNQAIIKAHSILTAIIA